MQNQRTAKKGKWRSISQDRIIRLEEIGFHWDPSDIDQSTNTEARGQVGGSDTEYETADEELPVERSSGSTSCDEKPRATKTAKYPVGTHVRKVRRKQSCVCTPCFWSSLTSFASLISKVRRRKRLVERKSLVVSWKGLSGSL